MALEIKDPDALVDYLIDWGSDYLDEQHIMTSSWSVTPMKDGGLAVLNHAFDLVCAKVTVGGGMAGDVYCLTNHVTLNDGQSDERTIAIRVDAR